MGRYMNAKDRGASRAFLLQLKPLRLSESQSEEGGQHTVKTTT